MSWYRTYRPQTISELNLPEARKELERIRQSGIFQHAYLFTGPKGTGKTSSARILAKMLNCKKNIEAVRAALSEKEAKKPFVEPCGVCQSCKSITVGTSLCVVEMDAASNRGIDDVRALRERVSLAPSDGLVTVYIIDEVHMLTTEAFNALLKVLEEPPRHVVFVLATTELHKVPETILSRCTVVQYHRASQEELIAALKRVATAEGTKIDHTALQTLADRADGSFRDAIKLFEQLAQGKQHILAEDVKDIGEALTSVAQKLLEAAKKQSVQEVARLLQSAQRSDWDMAYIQKSMVRMGHDALMHAVEQGNTKESILLQKMLQAVSVPLDPLLPLPSLPFELALFRWCEGEDGVEEHDEEASISAKAEKQQQKHAQKEQPDAPKESRENKESSMQEKQISSIELPIHFDIITTRWQDILKKVRETNSTLEALLRAARPQKTDRITLTIEVFYGFHKEQLEQERHRRVLEQVIAEIAEVPVVRTVFVLGEKKNKPLSPKKQDEELAKAAAETLLG